jgi:hypothetical protein
MSRVCGRSTQIITLSLKLLERCKKLSPTDVTPIIEIAYNQLMLDHFDVAYQNYVDASKLDESRSDTLVGMIKCMLL